MTNVSIGTAGKLAVALLLGMAGNTAAQEPGGGAGGTPPAGGVATVEITPAAAEGVVGQKLTFKAVGKDASGKVVAEGAQAWFAVPVDHAYADSSGTISLYAPGNVQIVALVGGHPGFTTLRVKPAPVERIDIEPLPGPLVVGGVWELRATPRTALGDPQQVAVEWSSETPAVATVDRAGVVTGLKPGKAAIRARAEEGQGTLTFEVIANPVLTLAIEPSSASGRTGDVVRFTARATGQGEAVTNPAVRWAVSGEGATIDPDGGFVAERPGTYTVTAASGDRVAVASIVVAPRNVRRAIAPVGRGPVTEFMSAEQWIFGDYAYLATIADRIWVYDVSDPAKPVKVDSIVTDARLVNDVSVAADGKIGVFTRENASNRQNGIVFFDASDPAHPKVVSEYTETVTGGVHSAFIDGHYVYLTDDATGSLRVIDFADVKAPKEVARWQVENPVHRQGDDPNATPYSAGRYLHDVYVKDGLIYLAYWRDGLVILDVGNGVKRGSPENPQFVSQLRFNHHELYGPDWLAGTHTVFRYEDYVFVGDEVFPGDWGLNPTYLTGKSRIPTRGILHVVDVSDIEHPRRVAQYSVPEAGAHNVWVADDVLYMGYYSGGGRVLDVSGELRGDLYAQGREIAHLWAGDPQGFVPNEPMTWGAQPHDGLIFFNDINSGLWIARLGTPREDGSTTGPGD